MSCALFVGLLVYGHRPFSFMPTGCCCCLMPAGPCLLRLRAFSFYTWGPLPALLIWWFTVLNCLDSWYTILFYLAIQFDIWCPKFDSSTYMKSFMRAFYQCILAKHFKKCTAILMIWRMPLVLLICHNVFQKVTFGTNGIGTKWKSWIFWLMYFLHFLTDFNL